MDLGPALPLWAFPWPWAALLSLLWMALAYALALDAVRVYADLFQSAFDLDRWSLYEAVCWEKPSQSGWAEIVLGERLSEFLWRGMSEAPVRYRE